MKNSPIKKILWLDLEMTGLNPLKDGIIEVAALVSDLNWNPLESYRSVIYQSSELLAQMDEWNQNHHSKSGLIHEIANGKPIKQVEQELLRLCNNHFSPEEPIVIAGNSIGTDRNFVNQHLVELSSRLHYRMLDVSSWKIVMKSCYNVTYEKKETHRALDDILESLDELKYYLSFIKI